jgi:ubiquinone/menaquinone biosynthesis C-methylase UbiE
MSKVDYSDIAHRYDNNPIRSDIPDDPILKLSAGLPWRVLDLGCGTGSYIESQSKHGKHQNIEWHGIDPSAAMLTRAKEKVSRAHFHLGKAETLPFEQEFFDYVTSRFSLHHFDDPRVALRDVHRVLKQNGHFKIVNIAPDQSPNWWIFKYFPKAKELDMKRFWAIDQIKSEVSQAGFHLENTSMVLREKIAANLVLKEARNRETSELLLIDHKHYKEGLTRLEINLMPLGDTLIDWGLMITELHFTKKALNPAN